MSTGVPGIHTPGTAPSLTSNTQIDEQITQKKEQLDERDKTLKQKEKTLKQKEAAYKKKEDQHHENREQVIALRDLVSKLESRMNTIADENNLLKLRLQAMPPPSPPQPTNQERVNPQRSHPQGDAPNYHNYHNPTQQSTAPPIYPPQYAPPYAHYPIQQHWIPPYHPMGGWPAHAQPQYLPPQYTHRAADDPHHNTALAMLSGAVAQLSSSVSAIAINMATVRRQPPITTHVQPENLHNNKRPYNQRHLTREHQEPRQYNDQPTSPNSKDYWIKQEMPSGRKRYWYRQRSVQHASDDATRADICTRHPRLAERVLEHCPLKTGANQTSATNTPIAPVRAQRDIRNESPLMQELLTVVNTWPPNTGVEDFVDMEPRAQLGVDPQADANGEENQAPVTTPESIGHADGNNVTADNEDKAASINSQGFIGTNSLSPLSP
jgi:hypothetical protein